MDQGEQVRPELDSVVVSQVRGQSGETGALRPGLQLGQLHEKAGLAGGYAALAVDQSSNRMFKTGWRLVRMPEGWCFSLPRCW